MGIVEGLAGIGALAIIFIFSFIGYVIILDYIDTREREQREKQLRKQLGALYWYYKNRRRVK